MKKNRAQHPDPEGKDPKDLPADSSAARKTEGLRGSAAPQAPGTKPREALDQESVTESIELRDSAVPDMEESPTENVRAEGLESPPPQKGGDSARDDTEEVFVILPEEGAGQLPVVETVVVESQSWEGGPTTTEVLKEVPSNISLEDVPLKKVNPLMTARGETERLEQPDPVTEVVGSEDLPEEKHEEMGVIDEIADIAADLNQDEPIDAGIDLPSKARARTQALPRARATAGSRRIRFLAMASSLAAMVLVGVFFWPDIQSVYKRFAGGGQRPVPAGGSGQAQALGTGQGGTSVASEDPTREARAARDALRSKILLAVQVGLRAEAGKE